MDSPDFLFRRIRELYRQIKWVVLARAVFALILIFSTLFFSDTDLTGQRDQSFLSLYKISGTILGLSLVYFAWLCKKKYLYALAYTQILIDTVIVTAIVFVTGCFHSIFTFLYLLVIIYAAMLLLVQGSFAVALASSIQYGFLIELEYLKIIIPLPENPDLALVVDQHHILYRIVITVSACFATAALSGILSLQLKTARKDLKIAQEHLKRVEKMAAVDEIVSGIAHEIKNPLASLSGSIQMLREEMAPTGESDKLMQIILRETERLKQIATDIRLISKPGRTNAELIDLAKAIDDVKTLFDNTPDWYARINIVTRLERDLYINMDAVHLQQILWNLIKNAAESIEGKGKIKISLYSPRHKRIYLTIQDTGLGIDKKNAPHIFDPFFTTKGDGTGLGLSIIHRIVDAYEGMIDFESIPGKGTVFTLIFQNPNFKE
ncbi:two-component system sensor histidine kinase NtrB [Desulfobacter vibrioformis]|uniref:two-component system sensor histidine kinase NtrB n=1 Tax=Desulfobacter vibrioformis TaxID=34031 RepID=UPI00054FB0A4|nr:ATP-binding protein [Desulfobacter vibrioformis]